MDLERLKLILNASVPDEMKENAIIDCLSKDDKVIIHLIQILESERKFKREMVNDLNLNLGRADVYIKDRPESKEEAKSSFNKEFVLKEIDKFYEKYKEVLIHLFRK